MYRSHSMWEHKSKERKTIMGIKVFLASFNKRVLMAYKKKYPNSEVNVLLSFGTRHNDYMDMLTRNRNLISSLILDSGAFSKNFSNSQEEISLPGFISYCKHFGKYFDYIFNYDQDFSMDGFETNLLNMRKIEKAGIKVVPVAHDYIGAKVPEVEYYIKKKYPIISLGYSDHKKKNAIANITSAVSKITGAGLKVHLLGFTSPSILGQLPVHYCDSSSWAQEGMYGNIVWWNPQKKGQNKTDRIRFLDKENTHKKWKQHIGNYQYRKDFEKYLKDELNFTMIDVYGHDKEFSRQIANVHYFIRIQEEIRKMHKKQGFQVD